MDGITTGRLHRRRFLQLGAAALMAPGKVHGRRLSQAAALPLGCVAGAIKKELREDWKGTLRRISAIGFKTLEFSDSIGSSDRDCRKVLDDLGIRAVAGGAGLIKLEQTLPEIVKHSHIVGKQFVASYWPWADNGLNKTLDDYHRLADRLTLLAGKLHQDGLKLVYHHHDLEFLPTDGTLPCDVLLASTDPSLMWLTLDVFWTALAGVDPAPYLSQHSDRIAFLHLGDRARGVERTVACLGEGTLHFKSVLEVAEKLPRLNVMIENPDATTGVACLALGYSHIRTLGY